jgi:hypothetical protein
MPDDGRLRRIGVVWLARGADNSGRADPLWLILKLKLRRLSCIHDCNFSGMQNTALQYSCPLSFSGKEKTNGTMPIALELLVAPFSSRVAYVQDHRYGHEG